MARDCDRCRVGLMRNKWLADYPNEHEFESALPCSTCTDAGSRFEQAKGAPLFEDTRSHRNQCTIHDGFENPGKHTWQPALSWEIEYLNAKGESGDPDLVSLIAECLALSEEDLKRAARGHPGPVPREWRCHNVAHARPSTDGYPTTSCIPTICSPTTGTGT